MLFFDKQQSTYAIFGLGAAIFNACDLERNDVNRAFGIFSWEVDYLRQSIAPVLSFRPVLNIPRTFVFLSYMFSCCTSLAIPKSVTLQISFSPTRTFRAARSRWIICAKFHKTMQFTWTFWTVKSFLSSLILLNFIAILNLFLKTYYNICPYEFLKFWVHFHVTTFLQKSSWNPYYRGVY